MTLPDRIAADPPQPTLPSPAAGTDIVYSQIARLELDELLTQLIDRAQDVQHAQGRLRGLLKATRSIASDLSLPVLLRRITETACELVGARSGALGVIGPSDEFAEFVTVGVEDDWADILGHLPHGEGILGVLTAGQPPLRLAAFSDHPPPIGSRSGHPSMRTLLGVPIRVRDQAFGNLYLAKKLGGGPFTAEDEELLTALAAAAATAIDNARLHAVGERKQRWLEASAEIARGLLAGQRSPLPLIATHARQVAAAGLATIMIPIIDAPDSLLIAAADGTPTTLRGCVVPRDGTLAGRALADETDLAVDDAVAAGHVHPMPGLPLGPTLIVRLPAAGEGQPGILMLSREIGAAGFDREEQDMAAAFASQAGVALELARAQDAERRQLLASDRDRIARDLNSEVIRRLFALGLGLTAAASRTTEPSTRTRLGNAAEELDETIRVIRRSIFQLGAHRDSSGIRARLTATLAEAEPALGFSPGLRLEGPLDSLVAPELAEHVTAVLRDALTNAARHADAHVIEVCLQADDGRLALTVTDDGRSSSDTDRRNRLDHMRDRAQQLGGSCVVDSAAPDGSGTHIEWTVPLT